LSVFRIVPCYAPAPAATYTLSLHDALPISIGGVIDRLEQKGWVRRVVSERDRRARELSLTSEGQRVYAALLPVVQSLQDDILQPLDSADRACFLELARRVVRP